jgi:hypothetical protein
VTAGSPRLFAVTAVPAGLTALEPLAAGSPAALLALPRSVHVPAEPLLIPSRAASPTRPNAFAPPADTLGCDNLPSSVAAPSVRTGAKSRYPVATLRSRRIESNRGLCRG